MLVIVPFPLETVDEADPPLPQGILKGTGLHELRFILIAAEVSNRFKGDLPVRDLVESNPAGANAASSAAAPSPPSTRSA